MIPRGVRRAHVLAAMEQIDRQGVPAGRMGWKFEVRHTGRAYPPKLLVSLACGEAFGPTLPSGAFSGGVETNRCLEHLGFTVMRHDGARLSGSGTRLTRTTPRAEPPPGRHAPTLSRAQFSALSRRLTHSTQLCSWSELREDRRRPPATAGAYAWFFRTVPSGVPTENCLTRDGMTLLYVGISPENPQSAGTLRTRLRFHYRGHAEGSTLRLTLGCLLEPILGTVLRRSGRRLIFGSAEQQLSQWMAEHTAVTWVEIEAPWLLEEHLLATIDLPLNIEGNSSHPFRAQLRVLRDRARRRAEALPDLQSR